MSEEQLKELQEYNLEYLEAQQSEEIFGGDYTSAVELKYAKKEIERLNNIINELEKEIDRLLERQYESERFAKEQGFDTYLPAKENLLYVKNKLQELKGSDKE